MSDKKQPMDVFDTAMTIAVADVLAQSNYPGLTESEMVRLLPAAKLTALEDGLNKRERLAATLNNAQVEKRNGAYLVRFVNAAMSPVRYASDPDRFRALQAQLNSVLVLYGYKVDDQGRFARARERATTLDEAAELAGALHTELRRRGCHDALMLYCREELLRRSLFHAMSEASKSIPDRLRRHTTSGLDGADLYAELFGTGRGTTPRVPVNAYSTDSEKAEHKGFSTLLSGIHAHYRNPRALHPARLDRGPAGLLRRVRAVLVRPPTTRRRWRTPLTEARAEPTAITQGGSASAEERPRWRSPRGVRCVHGLEEEPTGAVGVLIRPRWNRARVQQVHLTADRPRRRHPRRGREVLGLPDLLRPEPGRG
jgi:uncharacterized protein (TIGR02391 family)